MPIKLCTHLFPDDHRCGSPALRGEAFCYYHHPDREPVANPIARHSRRGFHLDPPADRASLQIALNQVTTRLAANKLDVHRASLILYSLQIASRNIPQ
ncbi:MAG: hypothetical protein HIU91_16575 [Acidobacteria bacterium]|nr:hypothetical protein [Acidobacteriota bacterium]